MCLQRVFIEKLTYVMEYTGIFSNQRVKNSPKQLFRCKTTTLVTCDEENLA